MDQTLPAYVTRNQWHCLSDASEGKLIAATNDTLQVFKITADGAVMHHARVTKKLLEQGLLREVREGRYTFTLTTRPAMRLPVKG